MIRFSHEANSWQIWLKFHNKWADINCAAARDFIDIGYQNISISVDIYI